MITSILRNKLLIAVVVIVVAGIAWYALSSSGTPASSGVLTSAGDATGGGGDNTIITTLTELQSITLSGTIFSNPAYATLKDFTTAITPEPTGRNDPFAPITQQSAATSTQKVQIFKSTQ